MHETVICKGLHFVPRGMKIESTRVRRNGCYIVLILPGSKKLSK